ncbi:MAG: single-stranded-DNA-specific exonuclease RecJ [Phycisphaerae bacterium]|jgi:single-stranded-DNA-specific exonuclease
MSNRWIISPPARNLIGAAASWKVPPLLGQLLINRGLSPEAPASSFLSPQLADLCPPGALPGAREAARLVVEAVRAGDKIVLYGDYDVDGIAGVAILWHMLSLGGGEVSYYVPHRIQEGYGLNIEATRRLVEEGARLLVTVDCGITAHEVADEVSRAGAGLVITDHHAVQAPLPRADAIVHPVIGGEYPNPDLCGAGVAFKLAWSIAQELSEAERVKPEYRTLLTELLPLAALGTVADVVALVGENRIIAKHGLRSLARTSIPGLRALMESAGVEGTKVDDYAVGFKLSPRLNAAGRMGHARLAVELLTRADADRAREIALYLEEHNRSRRAVEGRILRQAVEMVEDANLAGDARRAIVLASDQWHAGVIGIVAARMVERYHRPMILIALADGEGQGSGRSIRHFDLSGALSECGEHLLAHGGHAMAAGIRIAEDRIEAFTEQFVQIANQRLTGRDLVNTLRIDAEIGLDELTLPTIEAVLGLGPFGPGNPRPRLATDWVELATEPRCVGKSQDHLQASFQANGARIKAIGFGMAKHAEDLKQRRRCRVAFEPLINEFNGRRTVEMQMIDLDFGD